MVKWKYKSLEWIHKIREENYEKTKNKDLKRVVNDSVKKSKKDHDSIKATKTPPSFHLLFLLDTRNRQNY